MDPLTRQRVLPWSWEKRRAFISNRKAGWESCGFSFNRGAKASTISVGASVWISMGVVVPFERAEIDFFGVHATMIIRPIIRNCCRIKTMLQPPVRSLGAIGGR